MNAGTIRLEAIRRGGAWRYLLLVVAALLVPAAIAYLQVVSFLKPLFDMSTRSRELTAWLDSSAFLEVVRQLGTPEASGINSGIVGAFLVTAILAPFLAAGALAVAKSTAPLPFRELLAEAGELYPRMIRTSIASCVPLGVAGAGSAIFFHIAKGSREKALLEATADRGQLIAILVSVVLFWIANVTVEAGRAYLGAEPQRRSAFLAWWSGVRLVVRRPAAMFELSIESTVLGVGLAVVLTAIRFRITQSGGATILLAFMFAQLAVAALAWGRASRLVGFVAVIKREE
jgi:hypothetical protein